jgi:hypothetical protein
MDFDVVPRADSKKMDERNIPTTVFEIIGPNGSLGEWMASDWISDPAMVEALWRYYAQQMGSRDMANSIIGRLNQPQAVEIQGKQFSFVMRAERVWMPFSLTLLTATNSYYAGTEIPKDFRSRVLVQNPSTKEKRETEIYMNSPLRYGGLTFYQYQMGADDLSRQAGGTPFSVLQAVRNPSWLTPYIGCFLVALGLVIQFMSHLIKFLSRGNPAARGAVAGGPASNGEAKNGRASKRTLQETVRK